jgi:hypothetical protein
MRRTVVGVAVALALLSVELSAIGADAQPTDSECLHSAGDARSTGIGLARLDARKADLLRRLGVPAEQDAGSMSWCVDGGGRLLAAFDSHARLRFVASTSFDSHIRRVRTGSSLRAVKRSYPHAFWIGKQLLRAQRGSRIVFGSCSCGSVAYVGVTDAGSAAKIRYYAKRAGVPRGE